MWNDKARRYVLLVCAILAVAAAPAPDSPALPRLTGTVNDFAHVIDAGSASQIETVLHSLQAASGDVLVVAQKPVSKAEGRMVPIDPADPGAKRAIVEAESVRVLRRRGDLVISETRHGFICANAGVDLSKPETVLATVAQLDKLVARLETEVLG